jgi:hypothetical protein
MPIDEDFTLDSALGMCDRLTPIIGSDGVAAFKRLLTNLSARDWSNEPATFLAGLEQDLDSSLSGRAEPDDRTAEACVLNSLRCLRRYNKAAREDSNVLGSDIGVAATAFAEECSRKLGMERFVDEIFQTPGIRTMKFLQGFSHLCAAADPEPDGRRTEARMRSSAQTFVSGLESVTRPLWLLFARLTAAANGQTTPPPMELGRTRVVLEQLWTSSPPPNPILSSILDQRITTIRNATCHDGVAFVIGTNRCHFTDRTRSLDFSEAELRAVMDEHVRVDLTLVLALEAVIMDEVLKQLRLRRWRLRGERSVLQLAKGG